MSYILRKERLGQATIEFEHPSEGNTEIKRVKITFAAGTRQSFAQRDNEDNIQAGLRLMDEAPSYIRAWNVTDEDGKALPVTPENVALFASDRLRFNAIFAGWKAVTLGFEEKNSEPGRDGSSPQTATDPSTATTAELDAGDGKAIDPGTAKTARNRQSQRRTLTQ